VFSGSEKMWRANLLEWRMAVPERTSTPTKLHGKLTERIRDSQSNRISKERQSRSLAPLQKSVPEMPGNFQLNSSCSPTLVADVVGAGGSVITARDDRGRKSCVLQVIAYGVPEFRIEASQIDGFVGA
jgi:hypothetical protein